MEESLAKRQGKEKGTRQDGRVIEEIEKENPDNMDEGRPRPQGGGREESEGMWTKPAAGCVRNNNALTSNNAYTRTSRVTYPTTRPVARDTESRSGVRSHCHPLASDADEVVRRRTAS